MVAIGIDKAGTLSILAVSVSLSEAEVHWRDFVASLLSPWPARVKQVAATSTPA